MELIRQKQYSCIVRIAASMLFSANLASQAGEISGALGILPASILRSQAVELATSELPITSNGRWRGLVCKSMICELRPVGLNIENLQGQERVRISYATSGRRVPVKGEYTIAFVSGLAGLGKLVVPTWFTLRTPRNVDDAANGSLGVTIRPPDQNTFHIVPRWNQDKSDPRLIIYLETKGQRQRLGAIGLAAVEAGIKPSDILIWAGDLDGDGKLDLITRAGDSGSSMGLHLWLSSRAEPNTMVGHAAILENWSDVDEAEGC